MTDLWGDIQDAADVADGYGHDSDDPEFLAAVEKLVQYARNGKRGCDGFHPEYGFTCILPPHIGPHYDTSGGHWDARGQLMTEADYWCPVVLASGQRCQLRAGHREGYHIANAPEGLRVVDQPAVGTSDGYTRAILGAQEDVNALGADLADLRRSVARLARELIQPTLTVGQREVMNERVSAELLALLGGDAS